jgi:hypothetical protein
MGRYRNSGEMMEIIEAMRNNRVEKLFLEVYYIKK